jgi:hypothetical protein
MNLVSYPDISSYRRVKWTWHREELVGTSSMTQAQAFAFAILIGLMVAFIWGRLRYDLIAVLALLAAVFTGIVPHQAAFSGFGDDIVIIVASALVVSAAIERSGVIEAFLNRVAPSVTSVQGQVVILVTTVSVLSVFIKNIGAGDDDPSRIPDGAPVESFPFVFSHADGVRFPAWRAHDLGWHFTEYCRVPNARGTDGPPFQHV